MGPSAKCSGCTLTCTLLSGTQSSGNFYRRNQQRFGTVFNRGLHLIKPGLRMAAGNATSKFLKIGPGCNPHGTMCVVFFYCWKPPYYSSCAPISFSTLPLKLAMKTSKGWIQVASVACSWWNWWRQAESQKGTSCVFTYMWNCSFSPNEKGAKSSGVKSCISSWNEEEGLVGWNRTSLRIYSYWSQNGNRTILFIAF